MLKFTLLYRYRVFRIDFTHVKTRFVTHIGQSEKRNSFFTREKKRFVQSNDKAMSYQQIHSRPALFISVKFNIVFLFSAFY